MFAALACGAGMWTRFPPASSKTREKHALPSKRKRVDFGLRVLPFEVNGAWSVLNKLK